VRLRHWPALLALTVALAACGSPQVLVSAGSDTHAGGGTIAELNRIRPITDAASPALPVSVTSADGHKVTVTSADRIVPLNGSLAEIVFFLGLGDRVVGRDASTTLEEAAHLPLVSRGHDVSAEGVLSLRPTVVLGDTRTGPPEAVDQLRDAGVPVVLFDEAWTIDDIAPRITAVAEALGVGDLGEQLNARTEREIAAVGTEAGDAPLRVAFLYVRGTAGVYLLGGEGSGADAMVEAVGAVDVGKESGLQPFTPLTSEALVAAAPDVILVMDKGLESVGGVDGLLDLAGVAQTPAGRQRRIVAVEDGLLLNFGPRTPAALLELSQELYGGTSS